MSCYKDRACEYESLLEEKERVSKEKAFFEAKCKKYEKELAIMRNLQSWNEQLESKVSLMSKDIEALEKKEKESVRTIQRLRNCERDLKSAVESKEEKEKEILALIDKKSSSDAQLLALNGIYKQLKTESNERIEQLAGEKAVLLNEKSCLQARVINIKEKYKKKVEDLEKMVI